MLLSRIEILSLAELVKDFPEAENFELTQSESNGIGRNFYVSFDLRVKGIAGKFTATITDESDW